MEVSLDHDKDKANFEKDKEMELEEIVLKEKKNKKKIINANVEINLAVANAEKEQNKNDAEVSSDEEINNDRQVSQKDFLKINDKKKEISKKIKSRERLENMLFFIFTILYITIIMMQFDIFNRYKVKHTLNRFFGFGGVASKYTSKVTVPWDFYNSIINMYNNSFTFQDDKYAIVSSVRCTSRRFLELQSTSTVLKDSYFKIFSPAVDAYSFSDPQKETTDNYTTISQTVFAYDFKNSFLQLGGYVYSWNKSSLQSEGKYSPDLVAQVISKFEDYLPSDASAITLDFLVANNELQYICPVVITVSVSTSGSNQMFFDMGIISLPHAYSNTESFIRLALESFLFLILLYYTYFTFRSIILRAHFAYEEELDEKINQRKKNIFYNRIKHPPTEKTYHDVVLEEGSEEKIEKELKEKMYLYYIKSIIKSIPNLITIVNLVIAFFCFILWIMYITNVMKNRSILSDIHSEEGITFEIQNEMIQAHYSFEAYRSLLLINFLFLFIRLISIFVSLYESSKIFIMTIYNAAADLLSFSIFFISILLGFTFFSIFIYGRNMSDYNSIIYAIQQNMSYSLGVIDLPSFEEMTKTNKEMTLLYFILVIVVLRFIVVKMLLAIILHFFTASYETFKFQQIEEERNKDYTKKNIGKSKVYKFVKLLKSFIGLFSCKDSSIKSTVKRSKLKVKSLSESKEWNKDKLPIRSKVHVGTNKIQVSALQNEENRLIETNDRFLFNSTYNQDYAFSLKNPYFDAERDFWKLKDYYEGKYRKIYIDSIFFILFLGVLILKALLHTKAPWHNQFNNYLFNSLNKTDFSGFQDPDTAVNNIQILDVKKFVFNLVPSLFSKQATYSVVDPNDIDDSSTDNPYDNLITNNTTNSSFNNISKNTTNNTIGNSTKLNTNSTLNSKKTNYFMMRYNTLIQHRVLLTLRKSKFAGHFNDNTRQQGNLDIYSISQENTTSYTKFNHTFLYNQYNTYRSLGGYNLVMDLESYNTTKWFSDQLQNEALNDYLDFAIVEFFCDNIEYNFISYSLIIIQADYGAFKQITFMTKCLSYYPFNSIWDLAAVVMDLIFIVLVIYMWVQFFKNIHRQSRSYDQWYKETVSNYTHQTLDLRHSYSPEYLRKFFTIFDLRKIFELILLCLSSFLIYVIIKLYLFKFNFETLYTKYKFATNDIFLTRDSVYSAIDDQDLYETITTILIYFFSIEIIVMINLGGYFSLLIRTIETSRASNMAFFFILILIMPAFVFYSHLCFGESDENFASISSAIVECFQILFGNFNFRTYSYESPFFGPLFFFLFIFLINMILINLFVGVIYVSYTTVKEEIKLSNEKFSYRRTFCCYKKKKYIEIEKKTSADEELIFSLKEVVPESKMNINPVNALQAYDEIEKEVEQIKSLDEELFKNKTKLEDVETAYEYKKLGINQFMTKENNFKDLEKQHVDVYNILHLKKTLRISTALQQDILEIERYKDFLNSIERKTNFEVGTEDNKDILEAAQVSGNVAHLTEEMKELKDIFDEIEKLENELKEIDRDEESHHNFIQN